MNLQNISFEDIAQRAIGATGAIFLVSIADKEAAKMNKVNAATKAVEESPLYAYRHYAYTLIGAFIPELFKPSMKKEGGKKEGEGEGFADKYAKGIASFSDALMFMGLSQILEKQLPEYVQVNGPSQSYANYVLGADANVEYANQNYIMGSPVVNQQEILVERATGEQVFIDKDGNFVKPSKSANANMQMFDNPQNNYSIIPANV